MAYTLGEAAKAVNKSKATISKAVKTGKISATKNPDGSFSIEAAELHRVYPINTQSTVQSEQQETPPSTGVNNQDNDRELIELRVKLQSAQDRISDLEEDREHWRRQANMLLSAPLRQPEDDTPTPERKGFWGKLFGG